MPSVTMPVPITARQQPETIPPDSRPLVGIKIYDSDERSYIGAVWGHPLLPNGHVHQIPRSLESSGIVETLLYRYQIL